MTALESPKFAQKSLLSCKYIIQVVVPEKFISISDYSKSLDVFKNAYLSKLSTRLAFAFLIALFLMKKY